jgi:anti-anti-sigma factor
LQRSLLPRELPALERLAASARYLPASIHAQTGGDWYEILPLTETHVALSVGDVVGKGPTAAAVMGQLRSALAGYLLDGHPPAAALDRLDAFVRRTAGAIGSTCACLTLDLESGRLRFATAGHPPPLIVHSGHARFLTDSGPVLGAPHEAPRAEHSSTLAPGDSVVLYTDGLVERRDTLIDDGLAQLCQVTQDGHRLGPEPLTTMITGALLADGHDDDVALVVVRHLPGPLHRAVPAVPAQVRELRREVAAWAAAAALPADQIADLQLALGEAAANTVEHAYPDQPGDLDYRIARTPTGSLRVTVTDHGRWRPEPSDNNHRGRGLHIIRALSRDVHLAPSDTGTTVDFHLASPALPDAATPPPPVSDETPPAGLTVDTTSDALVLHLTGDLDLTTTETVRQSLLAHLTATDRPTAIDLTHLRYLSSSGIALLLDAAAVHAKTNQTLTVLVRENTPPARILALSGLNSTLTVHTILTQESK